MSLRSSVWIGLLLAISFAGIAAAQDAPLAWQQRLERLESEIVLAEDMRSIKRLQRAYGYYLDKGMWTDLADMFTTDAIARYPVGTNDRSLTDPIAEFIATTLTQENP